MVVNYFLYKFRKTTLIALNISVMVWFFDQHIVTEVQDGKSKYIGKKMLFDMNTFFVIKKQHIAL